MGIYMGKRLTTEEFIRRAKEIHGDKYNYEFSVWSGWREKIKIYCNECKKYFYQRPDVHFKGCGCRTCGYKLRKSPKPWNYKDLTGKRIGILTVIKPSSEKRNNTVMWECICDCGNKTVVRSLSLHQGQTKSCGCLRNASGKERTQRKFNRDKLNLTQEDLKKQLYYNPFSGIFRWRVKKGCINKWDYAGSYCKYSGYHTIRVNGFLYKAYVLAWLYMKGYFTEEKIDHIDRDRQNTKWNNLRLVNDICNVRNSNIRYNNTSGVTGVQKKGKKWIANITISYKSLNLGVFKNFNDAVMARWRAEQKYGFLNCNTTSSSYLYLKEKGVIKNEEI
jgi:hypothetical protein